MQENALPEITPEMLEQNPALLVVFVLVMLVVLLGSLAALASWGWLAYRLSSGAPVLPLSTPWRPRLWSFLDLAMIVGMALPTQFVLAGIAMLFVGQPEQGLPNLVLMAVGGLASLIGVVLGIVWIQYRYKQGIEHVGFGHISRTRLLIATIVGLAALPIIYLLMMVVSAVSRTEYEHPLIESAVDSGTPLSYLLGCFAAVIAAPIAEEFLFRVVLQGWLQSFPFKSLGDTFLGTTNVAVMTAARSSECERPDDNTNIELASLEPVVAADALRLSAIDEAGSEFGTSSVPNSNPYAPIVTQENVLPSTVAGQNLENPKEFSVYCTPRIPPIWPSVVAGVLFGLAHISYGWSCVPLSVLGIVLGLIYRQTHSVWPCILVHALLNSIAMLMLGLMILIHRAAG